MIGGHGGNIYELAERLKCFPSDIIDMSSNLNPLGPPEGLWAFLTENLSVITALPEANAGGINHAFAEFHGISNDSVLAGNGTTQFIHAIPNVLKSRNALILGPTYADYADACRMQDIPFKLLMTRAEDGFQADIRKLDRALEGVDTFFICNPNNPTGTTVSAESLENLIKRHSDTFFIVDESYLPFAPTGDRLSLIGNRSNNLIILSSMSKIFRIPGLRIGFVVASEKVIQRFMNYYQPWSVNSLAQAAVSYLMFYGKTTREFIRSSREFINREKIRFLQFFSQIKEVTFFPSSTSFILGRLSNMKAYDICGQLAMERMLIRDCTNFEGLSDRYIRISLKTGDINRLAAEKLLRILAPAGAANGAFDKRPGPI